MDGKQCEICHQEEGKYVCPKCGVLFCSVSCFRDQLHLECSEVFYEKCVKEELKLSKSDSKNMHNILSRTRDIFTDNNLDFDGDDDEEGEEEEEDEDDEPDLAFRMKNVDLDDEAKVWEKLSYEEKINFKNFVKSGEIVKILPKWQPWWKFYVSKKVICKDVEDENITKKPICPSVNFKIPQFEQLTKKSPAAIIPFTVVNILLSYAFTTRWFKGFHNEMTVEAVTTLLALSAALRKNELFQNCVEAYIAFENDLTACKWTKDNEVNRDVVCDDLKYIINYVDEDNCRSSVKASLCDIYNIFESALNILKNAVNMECRRFTGSPPCSSEIKLFMKRLIYYLSWTECYGDQLKVILVEMNCGFPTSLNKIC